MNSLDQEDSGTSSHPQEVQSGTAGTSVDLTEDMPGDEDDALEIQDDSGLEEQPSKRQRLEEVEQQQNDDEAVLALAAHGLSGPDDHYDPPE